MLDKRTTRKRLSVMRKVMVSLMVLSLVPAIAMAVVTNPEGFETYDDTTDWLPTYAIEGWEVTVGPAEGKAQLGSEYSGYGQAGKGMQLSDGTGKAHWDRAMDGHFPRLHRHFHSCISNRSGRSD